MAKNKYLQLIIRTAESIWESVGSYGQFNINISVSALYSDYIYNVYYQDRDNIDADKLKTLEKIYS